MDICRIDVVKVGPWYRGSDLKGCLLVPEDRIPQNYPRQARFLEGLVSPYWKQGQQEYAITCQRPPGHLLQRNLPCKRSRQEQG